MLKRTTQKALLVAWPLGLVLTAISAKGTAVTSHKDSLFQPQTSHHSFLRSFYFKVEREFITVEIFLT